MKTGFVGAGKVGICLGAYFKSHEICVLGYFSRSLKSAQFAADFTQTKVYKLEDLVFQSDIIFITTNDDEIMNVALQLSKIPDCKNKIIVHTSAAQSSQILDILKGNYLYSLHPLQTFADIDSSIKALQTSYFALEGDERKINILENLLKKTNNRYFKLNAQQKVLYHIGACIASNYLVTIINSSLELYESIGINKDDAINALKPLIQTTVENSFKLKQRALSGPIIRGDKKTIQTHLQALQENKFLNLYSVLGIYTTDLTEKNSDKIEKILKESIKW